jgi:virginiamycin B lyase
MSTRWTVVTRAGAAFIVVAAIAACGGGAVSPGGGPTPAPTATPAPGRASTASAVVPSSGSTSLAFPPLVGGITGGLTLPPASAGAGATVNGTLSLDPPASVSTTLQSARRSLRSSFVRSGKHTAAATTHTAVAYVSFSTSQDVTVNGTIAVSLTLPGAIAAQQYFLSFYDGTGWQYDVAGPSTPSGGTITFAITTNNSVLFSGGKAYTFAVTTDVFMTPSPSPSPAATLPPPLAGSSFRSYSFFGAGPYGILGASDGVWVTESALNFLTKLTPAGVVTQSPLGAAGLNGPEPLAMIYAPDATIWMTFHRSNAIAHVSQSGALLTTLPTNDTGNPRQLAYGSDGNLWYTQDSPPTVTGRMTPSGTVSHTVLASAAFDVAAGPDGNLWFAADTAVVKLTTAGSVTSYPEPAAVQGGSVTSICSGSDGNLWGAVRNLPTPYVLKITTAGVMTAYGITTAPSHGWGPAKIACIGSSIFLAESDPLTTLGPSNNAAIIAQLATDGTVTQQWRIPGPTTLPNVTAMALGPDQNLWFVDNANQSIDVWVMH